MIARQGANMYTGEPGMNGPIMGVSFLAAVGVSFIGVLTSVLVALLVGLLGKGIDVLVKRYFQNRENFWRKEAIKWKKKAKELEQQL